MSPGWRRQSGGLPAQDKTWARFRHELPLPNQLPDDDDRLMQPAGQVDARVAALTPEAWHDETASGSGGAAAAVELEEAVRERRRVLLSL